MIYSTNRISSIGSGIEANPKYYGAGAFSFMEECAKDELDIFENAITTDINEVILGESSYEMKAINEGFFANVWKKIKEIFKKFVEWIKAVTKSVMAKLTSIFTADHAKFAKYAKKRLKGLDNYKWTGKIITSLPSLEPSADMNSLKSLINKAIGDRDFSTISETEVQAWEKKETAMSERSVSDFVDEYTDVKEIGKSGVETHIGYLEALASKKLTDIKKSLKNFEKDAAQMLKKANSMEAYADSDNYGKDTDKVITNKENAQHVVTLCNIYKHMAQMELKNSMGTLRALGAIARSVVSKAVGTTVKEEYDGYDSVLVDAMNEAAIFECESAFEEMSEANPEEVVEDEELEAEVE